MLYLAMYSLIRSRPCSVSPDTCQVANFGLPAVASVGNLAFFCYTIYDAKAKGPHVITKLRCHSSVHWTIFNYLFY